MTTDKPPSINLRNKIILLYLIVFGVHRTRAADAVFHFPEYGYKENNKNVNTPECLEFINKRFNYFLILGADFSRVRDIM